MIYLLWGCRESNPGLVRGISIFFFWRGLWFLLHCIFLRHWPRCRWVWFEIWKAAISLLDDLVEELYGSPAAFWQRHTKLAQMESGMTGKSSPCLKVRSTDFTHYWLWGCCGGELEVNNDQWNEINKNGQKPHKQTLNDTLNPITWNNAIFGNSPKSILCLFTLWIHWCWKMLLVYSERWKCRLPLDPVNTEWKLKFLKAEELY